LTTAISTGATTATTGAGIFDSYHGLVASIEEDAESEGRKVLDVSISAVGAAVDTAVFVVDPLAGLLSAGVGWLIEHIAFLREPLDMLLGDPDEIQANVAALKSYAAEVNELAEEHRQRMAGSQWTGQAADAYHDSMDQLGAELNSLSRTVEGTATVVAVSGTLVTTLRSIVRDMIAALVAHLAEGALVAAASAAFTFGASIAGFIGYAVGRAAALGATIAAKISKLIAGLARQGSRLQRLGTAMGELAQRLNRFGMAAGIGTGVYDAARPAGSGPGGPAAGGPGGTGGTARDPGSGSAAARRPSPVREGGPR
jgi:uncharacterized protein YukE